MCLWLDNRFQTSTSLEGGRRVWTAGGICVILNKWIFPKVFGDGREPLRCRLSGVSGGWFRQHPKEGRCSPENVSFTGLWFTNLP